MGGRRGFYEIIIGFIGVVIIVGAVLFFYFIDSQNTLLYAKMLRQSTSPYDAIKVKDSLLKCHQNNYLKVSLIDKPCPAKEMFKGFVIEQLPINGCDERVWDFSKPGASEKIPFYLAIKDYDGTFCLAKLEVLVG